MVLDTKTILPEVAQTYIIDRLENFTGRGPDQGHYSSCPMSPLRCAMMKPASLDNTDREDTPRHPFALGAGQPEVSPL